jgi:hypothetical protein
LPKHGKLNRSRRIQEIYRNVYEKPETYTDAYEKPYIYRDVYEKP